MRNRSALPLSIAALCLGTMAHAVDAKSWNGRTKAGAATRFLSGMPSPLEAASAPVKLAQPNAGQPSPADYRLSGNKGIWPSLMWDDGQRTYIQWPPDQALPAVFAIDNLGREEMVNGYMRGNFFTIDRVHAKLVFRLDRAVAHVRRFLPKGRR